jgi:hypothetical protein
MCAADDDDPNVVILIHGGDQFCDLRACRVTDDVHGRAIEDHISRLGGLVFFVSEPVEPFRIAHPALSCCALAAARRRAVSRMASTMP